MPNLNFADIKPQTDTFTDEDGKQYEFLSSAAFGPVEVARINKLQQEFNRLNKLVGSGGEKALTAAEKMLGVSSDLIGLILPGLPKARREKFSAGQTLAVLEFWTKSAGAQQRPQNGVPVAARRRSKRSRN
ncbi:MAG TPA: hypothetical protein PLC98_05175 [Anaerolineales bacterium]|nr:hypothetical protein [Anaerolineales bacterium]